jgi:outer membrane receptor protein involved in Fe transport
MYRYVAAIIAALFCFSGLPALAATTGLVRGNVLVNNKPEAGVKLTLSGEGSLLDTTSDGSGNFVFSQVPFGRYTLSAVYPGVAERRMPVEVATDQVVTLNFSLGSLKVIGSATATAGAGVSGYPVSQNTLGRQQISALPVNNSLDRIIETVPGIVRFSYNEPVAHGFHGVTYEIDGAPMPLATSSNFAEIIDPKNIDSLEIFTGAMPAEFGGSREGAVINILTNRPSDLTVPYQGYVSVGAGNYGQMLTSLENEVKTGNTAIFFNANTQRSDRGLDAPTFTAQNDNSSQSDEFLRTITTFNQRESLAFDFSNQLAQFEIPTNSNPNDPYDPTFSVPGTNDTQREYDQLASLNFSLTSKDGNGVFQIIPWVRSTRIAYDGDLQNDVLGLTNLGPDATNPNLFDYQSQIGLQQDRKANYVGIRTSEFRATKHHAFKVGVDANRETFTATQTFACYDSTCNTVVNSYPLPPPTNFSTFTTAQDQAGTQVGIYAEDKWTPSQQLSFSYGLRYDHSTGYVGGNQISPRIGVNFAPDPKNVVHAYYGRFYAAPQLEDVRQACVVLQGCSGEPVYDLQPETDSYFELGLAHTFSPTLHGYINSWERNASNVLDTTQLLNTPLFAVFNNSIGRAEGLELRMEGNLTPADSWYVSGTYSSSQAAGVSGSTFLFPPGTSGGTTAELIAQLAPEDHDQTVAANGAFTHRWGERNAFYSTLQADYGTGYPVSFEGFVNGAPVAFNGRLPTHLLANWAIGRDPGRNGDHSLGFSLDVENLLNHQYIIKIANGFNTTQIAQGRSVLFRVTEPF